MADNTAIEWADSTWNPTVGCSVLSPGCTNCYAMRTAWRQHRGEKYAGLTRLVNNNPVWTGILRLHEPALDWPLRKRKPLRIFVNSMSDLFHESLPDAAIDRVFAVMALAPQHTFLVLTKRAQRMRDYLTADSGTAAPRGQIAFLESLRRAGRGKPVADRSTLEHLVCAYGWPMYGEAGDWPLPKVWLGVSVEDQTRADERIPLLLDTPAAKRFISAEPLLGPVDLTRIAHENGRSEHYYHALDGYVIDGSQSQTDQLDWVIAGGESGPGARPMHPDWARSLRDQCQAAGVPFFFKQWGAWLPGQNDPHPSQARGIAHWQDGGWGTRETRNPPEENYVMWDEEGRAHPGGSRGRPDYFEVKAWAGRVGKKAAGRMLDGREHSEFPA